MHSVCDMQPMCTSVRRSPYGLRCTVYGLGVQIICTFSTYRLVQNTDSRSTTVLRAMLCSCVGCLVCSHERAEIRCRLRLSEHHVEERLIVVCHLQPHPTQPLLQGWNSRGAKWNGRFMALQQRPVEQIL